MDEITLEEYKKFFDETPVALIRTSIKTGNFLMANKYAAQMFGFDTPENLVQNAKITDYYPIEERKALIRKLRKESHVKCEIGMTTPEGREFWVSVRLRMNCDGHCIEGSLLDITELVRLREKELSVLQDVSKKLDNRIANFLAS
jgi:PAS domain S-box-containing protein